MSGGMAVFPQVPLESANFQTKSEMVFLRRELQAFLVVGAGCGLLVAGVQIFFGYSRMVFLSIFFVGAALLLALAVRRSTGVWQRRLLAHCTVGLFALIVFSQAMVGGQDEANSRWWLVAIPLIASHLLGARAAAGWTICAAAAAVTVVASSSFFFIVPDGGPPTILDKYAAQILLLLVIFALGVTSRRVTDAHLAALLDRETLISEQAAKLEQRVVERTAALREANTQLARLALRDSLTGLPNRKRFMDCLYIALKRSAAKKEAEKSRADKSVTVVCFLDLDQFKIVNDSLGHDTGDRLLQAVASRLGNMISPEQTLARFGGDEFVLLLEDVQEIEEAIGVVCQVHEMFTNPFSVTRNGVEHEIFATMSIGIAMATDPGDSPEDLLRHADAAMYQAKERGRSKYEVFDDRMRGVVRRRLYMENALRRAIERNEFSVYYQNIVNIGTERTSGFEALLRWNRSGHKMCSPATFIRLAEEIGLIVPIGHWVLREACKQARLWEEHSLRVNVNLSARQLSRSDLVDVVADVLDETGCVPYSLGLEITETVLMDDPDISLQRLKELRSLGIRLSIDDFGTGYASLSYLKKFPIDVLKIDRSFVSGVGKDFEDTAIVKATVNLGHALGLEIVAEGVETFEQFDALKGLGCDYAQGYFLGRPATAATAETVLGQNGEHWRASEQAIASGLPQSFS